MTENVLNRAFTSEKPNEKWCTNVTEFKYGNGKKAYLSAIIVEQVNTQQQEKKNETSEIRQKRPDGKPVEKVAYLTFDDGPSTLTGQFLEVLMEQDIKATLV